jgi:hypothetical protein
MKNLAKTLKKSPSKVLPTASQVLQGTLAARSIGDVEEATFLDSTRWTIYFHLPRLEGLAALA